MILASATDAHSRVVHVIGVDQQSIQRDRNGVPLSFAVLVGFDREGRALFSEYMASHSTNNPIDIIVHVARDVVTAAGFAYRSVAQHGEAAIAHGPAQMKAQSLKGFQSGLLSGALAVVTLEVARHVLKHVTSAKYYIPVHGNGPDFLAPIKM